MRGRLITLEGIDGAGKSTHRDWIAELLRGRGIAVRVTREPGGTALGERLRALVLEGALRPHPETEVLLMFAARREHLEQVIEPALAAGTWVVCDRFTDASYAYQGGGGGVAWERIAALERWVHPGLQPDLTILLDLDPEIARSRAAGARAPDRFEGERGAFFERVRAAYLRRAREHPQRVRVVDAGAALPHVRSEIAAMVLALCDSSRSER
jgi:dTMP kinase